MAGAEARDLGVVDMLDRVGAAGVRVRASAGEGKEEGKRRSEGEECTYQRVFSVRVLSS